MEFYRGETIHSECFAIVQFFLNSLVFYACCNLILINDLLLSVVLISWNARVPRCKNESFPRVLPTLSSHNGRRPLQAKHSQSTNKKCRVGPGGLPHTDVLSSHTDCTDRTLSVMKCEAINLIRDRSHSRWAMTRTKKASFETNQASLYKAKLQWGTE